MKIPIETLEEQLNIKLKRNTRSLGVDPASKTGWCLITTTSNTATIDYSFIKIESKDIYFKYDEIVKYFNTFIGDKFIDDFGTKTNIIVIEDTFFGTNINTLKLLTRIGMILYVLAYLAGIEKYYILATQARAKLGLTATGKKQIVHKQLKEKIDLKFDDEDIIDAFILSLCGLIKEEKLDV